MRRRVLVLFAAVALAGTLSGCRGPAAAADPAAGQGAEQQVQQFESALREIEGELAADRG